MKYLVLEIHPGYAVLLDSEGRFIKAANLNYQVGDFVENAIRVNEENKREITIRRKIITIAMAAACFVLMFFGAYRAIYVPNYVAYGTVEMQINPDVQLTLSKTENVLNLEGINEDGKALIDGYDYKGKSKDVIVNELADRAIDMGYLSDGGEIIITASSDDDEWRINTEEQSLSSLRRHVYEISINVEVLSAEEKKSDNDSSNASSVVIPVPTPEPTQEPEKTPEATAPASNYVDRDDDLDDDSDDDQANSSSQGYDDDDSDDDIDDSNDDSDDDDDSNDDSDDGGDFDDSDD